MPKTFFVCGTDTEVGKTVISAGILNKLAEQGHTTIGMKPVAAGCDDDGKNEDALALQAAATQQLSYAQVNPVALAVPASPHIAAALEEVDVSAKDLVGFTEALMAEPADYLLIEGAGGWLCPINNNETLADFATALDVPVVLVVGMRLGCLNHALLSAQAIATSGLKLQAWVANCVDADMPYLEQNLALLNSKLGAPCLGVVPQLNDINEAKAHLDVSALVGL